jgi:pyroglutamyl-peptidase
MGTKLENNPSYAAIVPLTDTVHTTPSGRKLHLSTLEIPVVYVDVQTIIPQLHAKGYKLIIHLGIGRNGCITLEKRAHSGGYGSRDVKGCSGPLLGDDVYDTKWNVSLLVEILKGIGYKVIHI